MKRAIITAAIILSALLVIAATQATNTKEEVDLGGQVITTTTDAVFLSPPSRAQHAWIYVKSANPVCWGFAESAPTATSGGEWPGGLIQKLDNDKQELRAIRVISCAEGAAVLKVLYTDQRRGGDWKKP